MHMAHTALARPYLLTSGFLMTECQYLRHVQPKVPVRRVREPMLKIMCEVKSLFILLHEGT